MQSEIAQMLFEAVEELNRLRPPEERIAKDLEAPLAGAAGRLDSAGLINLIVLAEQKAAERLGVPILLTDDRTLARLEEVFGTLGSLADHIGRLVDESRNG